MRKIADIFLVLLLTVCAVFASYFIAEKSVKTDRSAEKAVTMTKVAVTEKESDRVLLCENNKRDYHFYKQGDKIIMTHKGVEYNFENWSPYIDLEKPQLYFKQMGSDPTDKIIIKAVNDINEDGSYVYGVYILSEIDNKDGTLKYKITALTRATTKQIIDEKVKIEISQAKTCKKLAYVAMCYIYQEIKFDRETGVPDSYYNPFHTLQDKNGNYMTLDGWSRGSAEYTVEDNGVFVSFPIDIKYKETSEVQHAGYIKCMLTLTDETREANVINKTMSFKPNMEYGAYRYDYDGNEWKSVCKNANKAKGGDTLIDYVQFEGTVDSNLETEDFSKNSSDLNKISRIEINQNKIILYANSGYTFKNSLVKNKDFSVRLTLNDGTSNNFDVSYNAELSNGSGGAEVLTINLDQPYKRENISKIKINFGVK